MKSFGLSEYFAFVNMCSKPKLMST
jgi:hypothetical protein